MQEEIHGIPGIALVCNRRGQILECLYDNLDLRWPPTSKRSLTQLVDRGSFNKALSFLAKVREERAVFGWELNVSSPAGVTPLHFAGFVNEDKLFIVGAKTNYGLRNLYEELTRINNDQLHTVNTLLNSQTGLSDEQPTKKANLYGEITSLNNELVSMQRTLAKKNVQLEKLNEQKNRFMGMATHDLRNPLHVILAFSKFLLDETSDELDAELVEILETIYRSSEFMTRMVNDLLDVAKIESGELNLQSRVTDLAALVRRTVHLNRVVATQKGIDIQMTLEPLPQLYLDPDKMEQVLNTLLSSAIEYSEPDSTIRVQLAREDNHALIKVQDVAQGLSEVLLDKRAVGKKGIGLGLVIVKRIIEGHGGEIWVKNEDGASTTFFISLPLHRAEGRGS